MIGLLTRRTPPIHSSFYTDDNKYVQVMFLLLFRTKTVNNTVKTTAEHKNDKSLQRVAHAFEVLSSEYNALLTAHTPLPETSLPQPTWDESHLSLDGFKQVVNSPIVVSSQLIFEVGEKKEVTWRQVRTIWRVGKDTPANPLQFCVYQEGGVGASVVHVQFQVLSSSPEQTSPGPDCHPCSLHHGLEDVLVDSAISKVFDVDESLLVEEWHHEYFVH